MNKIILCFMTLALSLNLFADWSIYNKQLAEHNHRIKCYHQYALETLKELNLSQDYSVFPEDISEPGIDLWNDSISAEAIVKKIFIRHHSKNEICEITAPSWYDYISLNCISDGKHTVKRFKLENSHDEFYKSAKMDSHE